LARKDQEELKRNRHPRHFVQWFSDVEFYFSNQSPQQFANDTAGLLDVLKIQNADVLGFSMGSLIAQELALSHPEKFNRLILYGASCGGEQNIPQMPQIIKILGSCKQLHTRSRKNCMS
jgi:pimeloyl-ACP methyl ester carboxylesterase